MLKLKANEREREKQERDQSPKRLKMYLYADCLSKLWKRLFAYILELILKPTIMIDSGQNELNVLRN